MKEREKGGERGKGWKERRARGMSSLVRNAPLSLSLSLSRSLPLSRARARAGEGEARPKDEELCKKRDETGRIPRDKRRRGRRRRRDGGTKEDHAGDYNINKQMSLEAGEFAIQSGTGGGREAESPPTNLEGLPRTLAPSLDLSSPSPACLAATKFLPLALDLDISSSFSPPSLPPSQPRRPRRSPRPCPLPSLRALSLSLCLPPSLLLSLLPSLSLALAPCSFPPPHRDATRAFTYTKRATRTLRWEDNGASERALVRLSRGSWYYCA